MREYPAYGRTIASHIVRGQKPIVIAVLLSSRWDYFNHVPKVCMRPDEWRIGRYELGFLRGLHVVLVPGDEATDLGLAELIVELMRVGPSLLWAFDASGTKLYDDDDAHAMARWARELAARSEALDTKITTATIATAERVMLQAQARAAELWRREFERIEARGELDASVRWQLREYETKDRVRELLSSPYRSTGDARAA